MGTRKQQKQDQPLLYIDNPAHEPIEQGRTEVEILYKRDGINVKAEVEEPGEEEPDSNHEEEERKRRSFNLSRHLGYDWQVRSAPSHYTKRSRERLSSDLSGSDSGRAPAGEHLGRPAPEEENKKAEDKPQTFADKSVKEKAEFLLKMRKRTPLTCVCKTKEQVWVGTVTAAEEQHFTMQTQQSPYLVTINYDDVTALSVDHFS
ncbi:CotO family spore coat protein [Natribacillus halophilus]|uniref:Spore coat protein CotO n=1 Tax=Natribacillus halophilus TaxID=549003 RepID=A0A1G8LEM0_9BACI|nr:CotO family spore coat protein [Natribacillus halophilus]SDI54043.1 Spore coat protein CotO [Natribacillus halophilus]